MRYLPARALQFPGLLELRDKYRARGTAEGFDPLSYYTPRLPYADLQVLAATVEDFGQDNIAD